MGNSHLSGWKTRLVYRPFRDRDFDLKFWPAQRDQAVGGGEARKKFFARVASDRMMPGMFARPALQYPIGIGSRPIDGGTGRSGPGRSGLRGSEAWSHRVRDIFGIRFHFLELTPCIASRPAAGGSGDVEQWKQIPRKAESGTHAFL